MKPQLTTVFTQVLAITKCVPDLDASERCQLIDILVHLINAVLSSIFDRKVKVEYTLTADTQSGGTSTSCPVLEKQLGSLSTLTTLVGPLPGEKRSQANDTKFLPLQDVQGDIENLLSEEATEDQGTEDPVDAAHQLSFRSGSKPESLKSPVTRQSKKISAEEKPAGFSRVFWQGGRNVGAETVTVIDLASSLTQQFKNTAGGILKKQVHLTGTESAIIPCQNLVDCGSKKPILSEYNSPTVDVSCKPRSRITSHVRVASDHNDYVKKSNVGSGTAGGVDELETAVGSSHPTFTSFHQNGSVVIRVLGSSKSAESATDHSDYISNMISEAKPSSDMSEAGKETVHILSETESRNSCLPSSESCEGTPEIRDLAASSATSVAEDAAKMRNSQISGTPLNVLQAEVERKLAEAVASSCGKDDTTISSADHHNYVMKARSGAMADHDDYALKTEKSSIPAVIASSKQVNAHTVSDYKSISPVKRAPTDNDADLVGTKRPRLTRSLSRKMAKSSHEEDEGNVKVVPGGCNEIADIADESEQAKYVCLECYNRPFPSQENLSLHIQLSHITVKDMLLQFICPLCSHVFTSAELDRAKLASVYVEHLDICVKKSKQKVVKISKKELYCIYCNADWVRKNLKKMVSTENKAAKTASDDNNATRTELKEGKETQENVQNCKDRHKQPFGKNGQAGENILDARNNLVAFSTNHRLRNHMMTHIIENETAYTIKCPFCDEERHSAKKLRRHLFLRIEAHIERVHHIRCVSLEVTGLNTDLTGEARKAILSSFKERHKLITERSKNMNYPEVQLTWTCPLCEPSHLPLNNEKSLEFHLMNEHVVIKEDTSHIACPECDWVSQLPYRAATSPRQVAGHYINHAILSHALLSKTQKVISRVEQESSHGDNSEELTSLGTITVKTEKDELVSDNINKSDSNKLDSQNTSSSNELVPKLMDAELGKISLADIVSGEVTDSMLHETVTLIEERSRDVLSDGGIVVAPTSISDAVHSPALVPAVTDMPTSSQEAAASDGGMGKSSEYDCILCLNKIKFADRVTLLRHFMREHVLEKDEQKFFNVGCTLCPHTVVRSEYARAAGHVLWALYMKILAHMIRMHGCPVPSYVNVYTCWKCGYEAVMRGRISQHMERQHNIKLDIKDYPYEAMPVVSTEELHTWRVDPRVTCDACGAYVRQSLMSNHKLCCPGLVDPSRKLNYRCDKCPRTFMTDNGLRRHLRSTHEKERTIPCSYCNQKFFARCDLHGHAWSIHKVNLTKKELSVCDICGEAMPRSFLSTHQLKHDQQEYMCDVCGKWLKGGLRIRDHKLRHIKKKKYKCHLCDYECREPKRLNLHHAAVHEKSSSNRCQLCKKLCENAEELSEHMKTVHPGGARINYCKICDRQLSSVCAFENHMFVAHRVNITKRKIEKCAECGFETLGESLMKKHMANHQKVGEEPVQCEICKKVCYGPGSLAQHKDRCHGVCKHQCSQCSFRSKTRGRLTKHIAQVHDKKRFSCKSCDYRTFTEARYKKHQRVVHGVGANEESKIISGMIKEYPAARVESRYVPPATYRNMFPVETSMDNLQSDTQTGDQVEAQSEVYVITTDEMDGNSYQLKYVVDPANLEGSMTSEAALLDSSQSGDGDIKQEVYFISQDGSDLDDMNQAVNTTDEVIPAQNLIAGTSASEMYVYYYPDPAQK